MILDKIDTSYWLTKNKEWKAKRAEQWETIEEVLSHHKKKGIAPIKAYFLRGKMPNWKALIDWNDDVRHLNVFFFLWLHPSNDEQLLTDLFRAYVSADLIKPSDIAEGYFKFLSSQKIGALSSKAESKYYPYLAGQGALYYKILYCDTEFVVKYLNRAANERGRFGQSDFNLYMVEGIGTLLTMRHWLILNKKEMQPMNNEFLLQYDQPLEDWYKSCSTNEDYFIKETHTESYRHLIRYTLYVICYFDAEKEGDTCRTRFIYKIRKILDERFFIAEIKQMWHDIKSGLIHFEGGFHEYQSRKIVNHSYVLNMKAIQKSLLERQSQSK